MRLKYPMWKTGLSQQDLFIERGQNIFSKAEILAAHWSFAHIIYFSTVMDDGLAREGGKGYTKRSEKFQLFR